mgnify:CR=1 FL=1
MLKAIAVGMFIYITYPMVVQYGILPDGLVFGVLYALSVVGAASFVEGKR